jgi:F0F1-type ATP synthase membrane subunit b/b'
MQRKISSAEEKLARYKSQIKSEIDSSADAVAKEILSQVLQHSEKKRKVAN